MAIVRLKGGMGNQMFQYAFGKQLAKKLGQEVKYDLTSLLNRNKGADYVYRDYDLDIFNVDAEFHFSPSILRPLFNLKLARLSKRLMRIPLAKHTLLKEPFFHYDKALMAAPPSDGMYDGWWQSHRYFEDIEEDLRRDFTFARPVIEHSKALADQIKNANAVCLNVRRTDFLNNDALNTTNLEYFLSAAELMRSSVTDPTFFIFSDDIGWCTDNLMLGAPTVFVDHAHKGYKFGNYLQLMSTCDHFIIPNSSFAYWAVWMRNKDDNTVIAPKNWFADPQYDTSDLVRERWLRV